MAQPLVVCCSVKLGEPVAKLISLRTTLAASAFVCGVALAPLNASATLFGLSSGTASLYTIDPTTGAATFVGNTNNSPNVTGLSFLGGTLYGSNVFGSALPTGTIDTTTAAYTGVSNQNGAADWFGLASDESAGLLYTIGFDDQTLRSMTAGGVITTIGSGTGVRAVGLGFDDANGILYAVSQTDLYTVDIIQRYVTEV